MPTTVHSVTPSSLTSSLTLHGGDIQFSGQEPPSEWMRTEPSFLTMMTRLAIGRWAVSRPA